MPNFLRRLGLNNESYLTTVGFFLGAGSTLIILGLATLFVSADVMRIEGNMLVFAGVAAFIVGLIGVVHWNMTE